MAIYDSLENIAIQYDAEDLNLSQSNKIYSTEGECLFEGPCNLSITESNEIPIKNIDFEELIDATLYPVDKKSILAIKEFENDFNSFEAGSKENSTDDIKALGLEINDYFETIIADSSNLNVQRTNIVDNRECNNTETEDNETNFKFETGNNDAATIVDTTHVRPKDNQQDIILIPSECDTQSIVSDGYHSSDFEFRTEAAAIINFKISKHCDDISHKGKCKSSSAKDKNTSQLNADQRRTKTNSVKSGGKFNRQADIDSNSYLTSPQGLDLQMSDQSRNKNVLDPGQGPSGINRPLYDYSNRHYRQNHLVPEGDDYLELFQGPYNPVLPVSDIIFLENKSIRPSPMNIQYEGIGFDKQLIWRKCQPDSSEDEYEDEAKENIEKVLSMYPDYNRKPRRKKC